MSNNNRHPLGDAPWFHVVLSTGFGSGFCPIAPGTAGALVALGMWWIGYNYFKPTTLFWVTFATIILVTFIGVWTSNVMERYWGEDPRTVNIDEFVGTWIPLLVAPCGDKTWILAIFGFSLFRLIDIFKLPGCRWIDKNMHGGWGVMLDDVLAGIYALILVFVVKIFIFV